MPERERDPIRRDQGQGQRQGWRRGLLIALVVLFALWPPLHMALATTLGFSSWKFFGWGMYATPFAPKSQGLQVYVLPEAPLGEAPVALAPALPPRRVGWVFEWRGDGETGGFVRISARRRDPSLRDRVALAKVLGSVASIEAVARGVEGAFALATSPARMLVLRIHPRAHPRRAIAYAEVDAYRVEAGRASRLGRFRSDERPIRERVAEWIAESGGR